MYILARPELQLYVGSCRLGGLVFVYVWLEYSDDLPGPVVIKKIMSPCSIWKGLYEPLLKREGTCVYTKEGTTSPLSKYRGFRVYSMNKTGGRRKMFITTVHSANAASWLSSCWAPSQSLLFFFFFYYGSARMINRTPLYTKKNYYTVFFIWVFWANKCYCFYIKKQKKKDRLQVRRSGAQ